MTTGLIELAAPLVAATLVVLTSVASLPALLLANPAAKAPSADVGPLAGQPLVVVRNRSGRWFVYGQPIAEPALGRLLRQQRRIASDLRFLPSAQLPAAAVSASLLWLRRQSAQPVALDLPAAAGSLP
jgi:hypothetical protein